MRQTLIIIALLLIASYAYAQTSTYDGSGTSGTITGTAVTPVTGSASAGDTTVVSVGANEKYKLYRVDFSSIADVTGTVNIQLGVVNTLSIVNATGGSLYGMNLSPLFVEGALGADLVINTPSAINYNVHGVTE